MILMQIIKFNISLKYQLSLSFQNIFYTSLDFIWPEIDENYIEKYINYIKEQKII